MKKTLVFSKKSDPSDIIDVVSDAIMTVAGSNFKIIIIQTENKRG